MMKLPRLPSVGRLTDMQRQQDPGAFANPWSDTAGNAQGQMNAPGGIDFAMLMRRKGWLVLGAIIGVILAVFRYAQTDPVYQTTAQILIQENAQALPSETSDAASLLRESTTRLDHAFLLTTPLVVDQAVVENGLNELPSLSATGSPSAAIRQNLSATEIKANSGVLSMSYRCSNPQDGQEIINGLIDSYFTFLAETDGTVSNDVATLISSAQGNLESKLNQQLADYTDKFQDREHVLWNEGEAVNVHLERKAEIEAKLAELRYARSTLAAKIRFIEKQVTAGADAESLLLSLEVQAGSEEMQSAVQRAEKSEIEATIDRLRIELADLSSQYGANHPRVKTVRRRLGVLQDFQRAQPELAASDDTESARPVIETAEDLLELYKSSLKRRLLLTSDEHEELSKLHKAEQRQAASLAADLAERKLDLEQIDRTKNMFNAVVQQLSELSLIKDVGGKRYRVERLSEPGQGWKVAPALPRFLGMGLALGLMAGVGVAHLIDRADQRFRSPEDVAQTLGLPIVGHIPDMSRDKLEAAAGSPLVPELVVAHRPKSTLAESYRAIRTALYFSVHGKQNSVIQITSPLPGDGKSTLIANLAIAIAQSGKRVLLIDADLRRPVQHKRMGIESDLGLVDVVAGRVEPPQAIVTSTIEHLSVLPCGQRPGNPAEVLTSPNFAELLDWVRDKYDFVLVDTPPMLAVSDPSAVAARVDGVLLTVRLGKNSRNSALTAVAALQDLGANIVGTVVNGVGAKGGYGYGGYGGYGGYRYGGYRYGGYSYGGYGGDEVETQSISKYYEEPVEVERR